MAILVYSFTSVTNCAIRIHCLLFFFLFLFWVLFKTKLVQLFVLLAHGQPDTGEAVHENKNYMKHLFRLSSKVFCVIKIEHSPLRFAIPECAHNLEILWHCNGRPSTLNDELFSSFFLYYSYSLKLNCTVELIVTSFHILNWANVCDLNGRQSMAATHEECVL